MGSNGPQQRGGWWRSLAATQTAKNTPITAISPKAQLRTRTGDPFLTMRCAAWAGTPIRTWTLGDFGAEADPRMRQDQARFGRVWAARAHCCPNARSAGRVAAKGGCRGKGHAGTRCTRCCFARRKQVSAGPKSALSRFVRSSCLAQGLSHSCLAEIASVTARMERGATGRGLE
jgi:hypothetical protein